MLARSWEDKRIDDRWNHVLPRCSVQLYKRELAVDARISVASGQSAFDTADEHGSSEPAPEQITDLMNSIQGQSAQQLTGHLPMRHKSKLQFHPS
jgi:hypothetical protein